jgi:hypothetical protein
VVLVEQVGHGQVDLCGATKPCLGASQALAQAVQVMCVFQRSWTPGTG